MGIRFRQKSLDSCKFFSALRALDPSRFQLGFDCVRSWEDFAMPILFAADSGYKRFIVKNLALQIMSLPLFLMAGIHPAWAGDIYEVNPADMRPTQGVVGFKWVAKKVEKFNDMASKELHKNLEENPAPAVFGPDDSIFILDKHHEFTALVELNIRKAFIEVIADFSKLTWIEFNKRMIKRKWLYFGDRRGAMTYRLKTLPESVTDLRNDPYRALASFLRKAGGFEKTGIPHAEFQWANALRQRVPLSILQGDPDAALAMALDFAESYESRALPGYNGGEDGDGRYCEGELSARP